MVHGKQIQDFSIRLGKINPTSNQLLTLVGTSKIQQNAAPILGIDLTNKIYVDSLTDALDTRVTNLENVVFYQNELISGGASFLSGLTFAVTDLVYIINGQLYNSLATNVTISAGDVTFDRIDIIVVNTAGVVSVIPGIPALNPIKPDIDESTQVEVTFITVPAGAVTLPIPITVIYNENLGTPTEWTTTTNFPSNINVNSSTGTPYMGSKSIELTNVPTGKTIVFSAPTLFDTTTQNTLQFAIKNKIAWTTTRRLRITLQSLAGVQLGALVDVYQGLYGFSSANTTAWQIISIPISKFLAPSSFIGKVVITTYSTSGTLNLYLDYFRLIVGAPVTTTQNTFLNIKDDAGAITTATTSSDILSILGGTNITSVVGAKTITLNLDPNIAVTNVTVSSATANKLTYFDGTKTLAPVTLGTGLTLTGNTLSVTSVLSGTQNYISKFATASTLGDSNIFDNGTKIGFFTATFGGDDQIVMKSASNADTTDNLSLYSNNGLQKAALSWGGITGTYYLKFQSGAGQDIILQPSGGNVGIGGSGPSNTSLFIQGKGATTGNYGIQVYSTVLGSIFSVEDYLPRVLIGASYTTTPAALTLGSNFNTQNFINFGNDGRYGIIYNGSGLRFELKSTTDGTTIFLNSDDGLLSYQNSYASAAFLHNVRIGFMNVHDDLGARLYIKGQDSSSAYYALKVDSTTSNLLFVRNDGVVNIADALFKNKSINLLGVESFYPGEIYAASVYANTFVGEVVRFWGSGFSQIHQGTNTYSISITTGGGEYLDITAGLLKLTGIPTGPAGTPAGILGIDNTGKVYNTTVLGSSIVTASGTTNYVSKFTSANVLGNSLIFDNGTNVGIGTATPLALLHIQGINNLNTAFKINNLLNSSSFTIENNGNVISTINDASFNINIQGSTGLFRINTGWGDFMQVSNSGAFYFQTGVTKGTSLEAGITNNYITDFNSVAPWNVVANKILVSATGTEAGIVTGLRIQKNIFTNTAATFYSAVFLDGNVGVGTATPTAKLHILQNTVSTGVKGISVNFNTIGEVFSIDDNALINFYSNNGVNITGGNGILSLISNGGINPYITFKFNNGSNTSGSLAGDNNNMFLFVTDNFGVGSTYFNASSKLHVKGINATSVNYTLKLDSLTSPLLYVRNDGNVTIYKTLEIQRYNFSATKAFWMEANSIEDTEMNTLNADLVFKTKYVSGSNVESIRFTKEGIIKIADTNYLTLGAFNVTTNKYGYLSSASNTTSGVGLKIEVCQPGNTTGVTAIQIEAGGNTLFTNNTVVNTFGDGGYISNTSFGIVNNRTNALSIYSATYVPIFNINSTGSIVSAPTLADTTPGGSATLLGIDALGKFFNTGISFTAIGSSSTSSNKAMVAMSTTVTGEQLADPITGLPFNDSYVQVFVNGIKCVIGDGVSTSEVYFADPGDLGTPKLIQDIAIGDVLVRGDLLGFDTDATDVVDYDYSV